MESEKFCLRWNDFETNISTAFRELRDDKDFFDVTLACDDDQIEAHKVILSACSPFFKTILKRNRHEHPLIYLKGVKYTELVAVLNFMYHGEVNVAQEELNTFLGIAEELKVKGLTQNNTNKTNLVKPKEITNRNDDIIAAPKKMKMFHQTPTPTSKTAINNTSDDDIQEVLPVKLEPVCIQSEPLTSPIMDRMAISNPYAAGVSATSTSMVENNTIFADDFGEFENYDEGFEHSILPEQMNADGNKDLNSLCDSMIEKYENDGQSATKYRYMCRTCGKVITSKKDMRRHVETHLDISHPCSVCQRTFKTRSSLALHYSLYHKNEVNSPWSMS